MKKYLFKYTYMYGNAFNDPQKKKKCMNAIFEMILDRANAWLKLFFFYPVGPSNFQWPLDGQVHAMDHHGGQGVLLGEI